jgi:co-chaperonin GroES (HSP10)
MIQAIGERIVVQKDPPKVLMEGGILIPEMLERTPRFAPTVLATVVSVGARCKVLQPGMRVALKCVAGDDYMFDDQGFTVLREKDVVGMAEEASG